MEAGARRNRTVLISIIAVSGILPMALYWFFIGRVPTVTPRQAKVLLEGNESSALLVDVRDPTSFDAGHLEGVQNWPYADIMAVKSRAEIPAAFRDRDLILICESGITSALAVSHLQKCSIGNVYNLRGGMQAWIGDVGVSCPLRFLTLENASDQIRPLPFKESSLFEQWMACVAAFGFKPLYMLLSVVLAVMLWRLKSPDMVALRWAFIFFFIGEAFCAANYLVFGEGSFLAEYLHSFGMALAFGCTTYALLEGLDLRVVRYSASDEKCAALGLCGSCIKYADVPCGFKRLFFWLIPSLVILAFMPLLASFHSASYNTNIVGTLYNYSHAVIFQIFEIRYAPFVAILFFVSAFFVLWRKEYDSVPLAKLLFAAGMGFFGFSMFRLILLGVYQDNLVWFVFWEEMTELVYILMAGIILWIFKDRLFREKAA